MRRPRTPRDVSCTSGTFLAAEVDVLGRASAFARPDTTNSPAIFTAKVTLTDTSVTMHPNHAARGSYVSFIITNRGRKKRTFVFGDVKRGPGHTTGFARTLAPNKQLTVVLYLDYRGVLRYVLRAPSGASIAKGAFKIL